MALTPEGIVRRAEERRQREKDDLDQAAERSRLRFLRFLASQTHRFRYRGSLQMGGKVFSYPLIEVTERPLALVTRLRCGNSDCGHEYDVSQFCTLQDELFWMPCAVCHWPVTLKHSCFIYGNNTFPVLRVQKGMLKHHPHTLRYENWLRVTIEYLEEVVRQTPDGKESILWDEDERLPEVRMRTSVESDEETIDSVPKAALKTWGFGEVEVEDDAA